MLRFSRHAARVVRVGFVIWFTWRWLGPQRSEACRLHAGVLPGRAADDAGSEPVRKMLPPAWRLKLAGAIPVGVCLPGGLLILCGLSLNIPYVSPNLTSGMAGCCAHRS